jgi:FtsH ternary system domain X7
MGLAREAACRCGPDDSWWAEVDVPWQDAADLVFAAGGRAYVGVKDRWAAITFSDDMSKPGESGELLDVSGWGEVELADLVVELPLRPRKSLPPVSELHVLVPGTLGRWVLHRALALDLSVAVTSCRRRPLREEGDESGVLMLRLRARRGMIPASLIHSISNLPFASVCQPTGLEGERLLVDIRYQAPLPGTLLAGMIPDQETWALGPPDVGHWRVTRTGDEIDGESLVEFPQVTPAPAPNLGPVKLPEPIPVTFVNRPGGRQRIDAVLLDEAELKWARVFLVGRPAGELAFLFPGQGVCLLTAPGGLPEQVPFGTPLVRIGPGALYLELGLDFYPPLPEGARAEAFGLTEGTAVAVAGNGSAYRFDLEEMVPAWTLWVGEPPEVKSGLDRNGQRILSRISDELRAAEAKAAKSGPKPPKTGSKLVGVNRSQLRMEAQRAQDRGDLAKAAEFLEAAGDHAAAGRLYEDAARELPR